MLRYQNCPGVEPHQKAGYIPGLLRRKHRTVSCVERHEEPRGYRVLDLYCNQHVSWGTSGFVIGRLDDTNASGLVKSKEFAFAGR